MPNSLFVVWKVFERLSELHGLDSETRHGLPLAINACLDEHVEWGVDSHQCRLEGEDVDCQYRDLCCGFYGSFRAEVFLADLYWLSKYCKENPSSEGQEYVINPLLGHFKNEVGTQYYLTSLAVCTKSGLKVKMWVGRLLEMQGREWRHNGPGFCDELGQVASSHLYEREILEHFQMIQEYHPDNQQRCPSARRV